LWLVFVMSARTNIWRVLLTAGCLLVPCSFGRADDTNPPVIATPPVTISPPAPTAPPPTDADRFFTQYARAVQLVRRNSHQAASITMDLLWRNLGTSPWFEIALLKHGELNEVSNPRVASEDYDLLRKRVENAPYFQSNAPHAAVFRAALLGTVMRGIDRIRILRVRDALDRYHIRYQQYPESLVKLSIFNYIDLEDIYNSEGRFFHYTPTGQLFTPVISYQRYDLEALPPEPFYVTSPKVDGTTRMDEKSNKFAALIRVPGRMDPQRVVEDQTLDGYLIAAIAAGGAVVCTSDRVLVLPVPQ
jgi:hypothetical protein